MASATHARRRCDDGRGYNSISTLRRTIASTSLPASTIADVSVSNSNGITVVTCDSGPTEGGQRKRLIPNS